MATYVRVLLHLFAHEIVRERTILLDTANRHASGLLGLPVFVKCIALRHQVVEYIATRKYKSPDFIIGNHAFARF